MENSAVDSFILSMGSSSEIIQPIEIKQNKIPIVYNKEQSPAVSNSTRIARYNAGKECIVRCNNCNNIVSFGKKTNNQEDKMELYCFNCNRKIDVKNYIALSSDRLWFKPKNQKLSNQFDSLLKTKINNSTEEIKA